MNTDQRASDGDRGRLYSDPISIHRRLSAVRPSAALLFISALLTLVFTHVEAIPRISPAQTEKLTSKLKDPEFISEGARLFAPNCGSGYCHGANGVGGGAPKLRGKELNANYVFKTISNGISGTAMLSFKTDFSEEQIWKLVAFILSDSKAGEPPPASPTNASSAAAGTPARLDNASATLAGSAQTGKALFFDSAQPKSCQACHAINGEGAAVGPDLSAVGSKAPRELFSATLMTRPASDSRYAVLKLLLKNGDKVIGIKKDEDPESVRVYDIAELPAVLRTVQKSDIAKSEAAADFAVHKDNAKLYTIQQLLDLVTFLKSSQSKAPVTLMDIL
ncbi:MAG TPA: c-type cytochrome [Blastocatellia bacterium]|nr:c-type cytochrome [Blastocatellia bacterium]